MSQQEKSSRIITVLARSAVQSLPTDLAWLQSGDCEGSRHHSPSPLLIRPYNLTAAMDTVLGQCSPTESETVYLCSTCKDNLTVYLSVLYAYDGAPPLAVKRDFGNIIRALGDRAWNAWRDRSPVGP